VRIEIFEFSSAIQFGGLLKSSIMARGYKKRDVRPQVDMIDNRNKKIVKYNWDSFPPFILDNVRTVIDIPRESIRFYIHQGTLGGLPSGYPEMYEQFKTSEDNGFYVYELKKGVNRISAHRNNWIIKPIRVSIKPCPTFNARQDILAGLPGGFNEGESVIQIDFDYTDSEIVPGKIIVPPPVLIATKGINKLILQGGETYNIQGIDPPNLLVDLIEHALLPPLPQLPRGGRQAGGAIQRIDDNLDDMPYIMALQKLWEEKHKHYKDLEPEYQQLLPEPDESPVQNFKEPFHEYIDSFGDQELLEEARSTIGLMSPEKSQEIFIDDDHHVNSLYEKALPQVSKDWIPIFVRADMLRLLLDK
jgi:hypothetical protein